MWTNVDAFRPHGVLRGWPRTGSLSNHSFYLGLCVFWAVFARDPMWTFFVHIWCFGTICGRFSSTNVTGCATSLRVCLVTYCGFLVRSVRQNPGLGGWTGCGRSGRGGVFSHAWTPGATHTSTSPLQSVMCASTVPILIRWGVSPK